MKKMRIFLPFVVAVVLFTTFATTAAAQTMSKADHDKWMRNAKAMTEEIIQMTKDAKRGMYSTSHSGILEYIDDNIENTASVRQLGETPEEVRKGIIKFYQQYIEVSKELYERYRGTTRTEYNFVLKLIDHVEQNVMPALLKELPK